MKIIGMFFVLGLGLLHLSTDVVAQTTTSAPRKVKTKDDTDFYEEASFRSKKIGSIPSNTVLEQLDESGGYFQVKYKNKIGWVFKVEVTRHMDVPAPDVKCFTAGYKIISGVYRYFFVLKNEGVLAYNGKVTLKLFDKDDKVIYEKTTDFSDKPIEPEMGGTFYIDTTVEAPHYEFENKDGKVKTKTGKFIERL
ncbi:MAG: SH3 domain-containing protein [Acidobacteria bacterium]|nr:SH3 domain-containing protein [Acidobacteriota bacterium]